MGKDIVGGILAELDAPGADVVALLRDYEDPANDPLWRSDPDARLYRAFAQRLIAGGHVARAYELVQNGLAFHKDNADLRFLTALALARAGNRGKSREYADQLLTEHGLPARIRVNAISLTGRLKKDEYERAIEPERRRAIALESAMLYASAYAIAGDVFPGINAATMSLLGGRTAEANALAAEVYEKATNERRLPAKANDYWLLATLGEAAAILGRPQEARERYAEAAELAANQIGDRVSMRRQVVLLAGLVAGLDTVLEIFNVGGVVVFAGHMIDHPERAAKGLRPRFPPDPALERAVGEAIGHALDELRPAAGYASAACGADILFAEDIEARDAESHVVLPFNLDDFRYTSVDFGFPSMQSWRDRCDRVLTRATEVHYATTEHFWGDEVLFEWVNTLTQGLAVAHASRLGVEPHALVVLDESRTTKPPGGTAYFLDRWLASGRKATVVDLGKLREPIPLTVLSVDADRREPPRPTVAPAPTGRKLKAMVFADVKNYSKLHDEKAPSFFTRFLDEVAGIIEDSKRPPEFQNTWGDGLYLVFGGVDECADFALRLLERVRAIDWPALGLPEDTTIRMGIHAGPVYRHLDKIIARYNYFGSHVNRAARIEPVTLPGAAFTSEQFAAAVAVEAPQKFVCEFVGVEWLAKDYDRCALYRLARR